LDYLSIFFTKFWFS